MNHGSYRPDIDGLRAVAVLAVLIYHAFPDWLPGGFVGVDVFFVISGYLITGIILKGLADGDFSLLRFYARRVRRIFPALALVIAVCLIAGWFLLMPDELEQLGKHAAAGATFLSNIILWRESSYFGEASSKIILLHLWSLGIEEQFYAAWPLLILLVWRMRVPAHCVILAVLLFSFVWNTLTIGPDPVGTFYFPHPRAWELAAGALVAARPPHFTAGPRQALGLAGMALILFAAIGFSDANAFPGWRAALPVMGAAWIIAAGPGAVVNRLLSTRLPVAIGKISYPLYLWHWPLLAFPEIMLDGQVPAALRASALAAAFILAATTYLVLEHPLRGDRALFLKASILTAAMTVVGGIGALVYVRGGMPSRPPMAPYADIQARLNQQLAWPFAENSNCLNRYPSADRREGWWFCVLEEDAAPTLFLVGNSFANHLYPGVVEAFPKENVLQFGSCDPGIGLSFTYPPQHPCFGDGRQRQEAMVSRIIEENPTIDQVILSAPWPSFGANGESLDYFDPAKIEGEYRSVPPVAGETSYDAYMAALERRIAFLDERKVASTLVLMTPELGYNPRTCYSGRPLVPAANNCELDYATEIEKQRRFREGLHGIRSRHPSLRIFDALTVLCRDDTCNLKGTDGPLLRDVGHLSEEGSRRLGAALVTWLGQVELRMGGDTPAR